MQFKANYIEPCTCGCNIEQVLKEQVWRIITWKCTNCKRTLATAMISDSPVASCYVIKELVKRTNHTLREEKGLEPKKTFVSFYDDNGNIIRWNEIEKKNKNWERRMGCVQRKAF